MTTPHSCDDDLICAPLLKLARGVLLGEIALPPIVETEEQPYRAYMVAYAEEDIVRAAKARARAEFAAFQTDKEQPLHAFRLLSQLYANAARRHDLNRGVVDAFDSYTRRIG